jgi:menaquinone-dependent protoporphyrinogen oxidase
MRCLIVYCSSHGTTEKAAHMLQEYLNYDVEIADLKKSDTPDLSGYDAVLIGGSIHYGRIQGKLRRFIHNNRWELMRKKLGLFLCCMSEGEQALKQFEHAFDPELREASNAIGLFGGEFYFSRMNRLERFVAEKVSGEKRDVSKLNVQKIKEFADSFNAAA